MLIISILKVPFRACLPNRQGFRGKTREKLKSIKMTKTFTDKTKTC
jgi:hypothetical protein